MYFFGENIAAFEATQQLNNMLHFKYKNDTGTQQVEGISVKNCDNSLNQDWIP